MLFGSRPTIYFMSAALLLAAVLGSGCGGVALQYDDSPSNPVIVYRRLQALAPASNPDAPVYICYGDGKVVLREDAYRYVSGKLPVGGLQMILEALEEEGFFRLGKHYEGRTSTGAITEVMRVRLEGRTHEVSTEGEPGPPGWNVMTKTVTDVDLSGAREYFPPAVRLFATRVREAPGGSAVLTWPGQADELGKAASTDNGSRIEGKAAESVWKAARRSYESDREIFYRARANIYGNVHASPIFEGVGE